MALRLGRLLAARAPGVVRGPGTSVIDSARNAGNSIMVRATRAVEAATSAEGVRDVVAAYAASNVSLEPLLSLRFVCPVCFYVLGFLFCKLSSGLPYISLLYLSSISLFFIFLLSISLLYLPSLPLFFISLLYVPSISSGSLFWVALLHLSSGSLSSGLRCSSQSLSFCECCHVCSNHQPKFRCTLRLVTYELSLLAIGFFPTSRLSSFLSISDKVWTCHTGECSA